MRVEYEIQPVEPFLPADAMESLVFELDIEKWELNRTHWAVKDINLAKELSGRGIQLPAWVQSAAKAVDITTHQFDVALSFPGEVRGLVEEVARNLEALAGPNAYFYDNNYVAQLARPALDVLLQDIYRNRSKLIVVFVGADYERKDWCGIEFRAIRDIIATLILLYFIARLPTFHRLNGAAEYSLTRKPRPTPITQNTGRGRVGG